MRLYVFKQRLQYKCNVLNIGYKEVDEAYTSKTCTKCGCENEKTSSKTFKCVLCKYVIDRDINGARNIMLKAVPKLPSLKIFMKKYKKLLRSHKKILKKVDLL